MKNMLQILAWASLYGRNDETRLHEKGDRKSINIFHFTISILVAQQSKEKKIAIELFLWFIF